MPENLSDSDHSYVGPGIPRDQVDDELDAAAFGTWLYSAYQQSPFKSITELAGAVGSNKATISRLMSAAPQTLTGKPSRPRPALVRKLAQVLNADLGKGLLYAGYLPPESTVPRKPKTLPELLEALDALGIEIDWATVKGNFENYTPEDFEMLKEQIAANAGVQIRRITNR